MWPNVILSLFGGNRKFPKLGPLTLHIIQEQFTRGCFQCSLSYIFYTSDFVYIIKNLFQFCWYQFMVSQKLHNGRKGQVITTRQNYQHIYVLSSDRKGQSFSEFIHIPAPVFSPLKIAPGYPASLKSQWQLFSKGINQILNN